MTIHYSGNAFDRFLNELQKYIEPTGYDSVLAIKPNRIRFDGDRSAAGLATIFDGLLHQFRVSSASSSDNSLWSSSGDFKNSLKACLFKKNTFRVRIDISQLQSISASKSSLSRFGTLSEFGERNYKISREQEGSRTLTEEEYFDKCIADGFDHNRAQFWFSLFAPSLKWVNSDGSHRVSTAHYMAKQNGFKAILEGDISLFSLNRTWLSSLNQKYQAYIFEVPVYTGIELSKVFRNDQGHVHATITNMERGLGDLTSAHPKMEVVLLLLHRDQKLLRVGRRWLHERIFGEGLELNVLLDQLYQIEDEANSWVSQFIIPTL